MEQKPSRVKNSDQKWPAIYYGLHMVQGVAEYADGPGGEPYRIFISEETAKQMDPTFEGKPVYVDHVDDEAPNAKNKTVEGLVQDKNGESVQKIADGYVIESFYNVADGAHWAKFIVTSEEGAKAIERKWQLSNCYQPEHLGPGGEWHGVKYSKEFTAAEYKHLAIVQHPRYRESIILTPEEFKQYNEQKVKEIAALRNSADVQKKQDNQPTDQGGKKMSLLDMMFGRKNGKAEKVENAKDIAKIEVRLGKDRVVTLGELIKNTAKLNDEDYEKMMVEPADRPEHNDDDDDKMNDEDEKEKNKKKSSKDEDEKTENDDDDDKKNDEDEKEENKKKSSKDEDEKDNDADDEKDNAEFHGRGQDGSKDFVGNKKNRKKSDLEDLKEKDNEGEGFEEDRPEHNEEMSPLKHVIMLDDQETTVGDMINDHLDLKNKYNVLRKKHDDLKSDHAGLVAKYGDDDAYNDDMEIPERDADMQTALGKIEDEEEHLAESMEMRKNAAEKILGKMKNSEELKAKREEKLAHFTRLRNAESTAQDAAELMEIPTDTSDSMLKRGQSRYGSGK